jgi:hypothetical protein
MIEYNFHRYMMLFDPYLTKSWTSYGPTLQNRRIDESKLCCPYVAYIWSLHNTKIAITHEQDSYLPD